jgi:uncharacterized protein (TIGR04255 family)
MPRKYVNDPIAEAVCEFRLLPDSPWDLATPGLLYESLKDRFPHREQEVIPRIEMKATEARIEPQIQVIEQIRFVTEDKKSFVRIAPRVLAVHRLRPYESWEGFRPDVALLLSTLRQHVDVSGFERVGLRYINRIEIPEETVDLDKYFGFRPALDASLPQDIQGFIVGAAFPFEDDLDLCRIQLADAVQEEEKSSAFVLDLDYWVTQPGTVELDGALAWIDRAHLHTESLFEGCISEPLRRVFGVTDATPDIAS